MRAIKKVTYVQNSTLIIDGLDSLNYKEVEVIIVPLTDKEPVINTGNSFPSRRK
ncbi:MAG: hypothetical protein V1874_10010 [Spirochaetota bacterium]